MNSLHNNMKKMLFQWLTLHIIIIIITSLFMYILELGTWDHTYLSMYIVGTCPHTYFYV